MAPSRSPLTLVMSPFSTAAWSGNLCDLSCLGSGAISTGLSQLWPSLAGCQGRTVLTGPYCAPVYSTTLPSLSLISPPVLSRHYFTTSFVRVKFPLISLNLLIRNLFQAEPAHPAEVLSHSENIQLSSHPVHLESYLIFRQNKLAQLLSIVCIQFRGRNYQDLTLSR